MLVCVDTGEEGRGETDLFARVGLLKMMNFILKMMDFVLKLMNFRHELIMAGKEKAGLDQVCQN